ncbi:hypothetical protein G9A89_009239 [Geosiphon pyriformis]|nr:hypothetical protein G9A89_009239 [Geosiphon pyriformis]
MEVCRIAMGVYRVRIVGMHYDMDIEKKYTAVEIAFLDSEYYDPYGVAKVFCQHVDKNMMECDLTEYDLLYCDLIQASGFGNGGSFHYPIANILTGQRKLNDGTGQNANMIGKTLDPKTNFQKIINGFLVCSGSKNERNYFKSQFLFVFDEARILNEENEQTWSNFECLQYAMRTLPVNSNNRGVFCVFLDTTSKIYNFSLFRLQKKECKLFPLFTEIAFVNLSAINLLQTLAESALLQHFFKFRRPLWMALHRSDCLRPAAVISFTRSKKNGEWINNLECLAILGSHLCLNIVPQSKLASTFTLSYMRCVSEATLAEASAQITSEFEGVGLINEDDIKKKLLKAYIQFNHFIVITYTLPPEHILEALKHSTAFVCKIHDLMMLDNISYVLVSVKNYQKSKDINYFNNTTSINYSSNVGIEQLPTLSFLLLYMQFSTNLAGVDKKYYFPQVGTITGTTEAKIVEIQRHKKNKEFSGNQKLIPNQQKLETDIIQAIEKAERILKEKFAKLCEATVGSVIAVMKKTAKVSGSESGFKAVASRKKRKEGALAEGVDNKGVAAEVPGGCLWGLETGDTTESESVDIKEECLVEETSFDYGEGGALTGGDYDQTLTSSKVKTKKALGKPLGKIDFSKDGSDDGVLSDALLELPPPMKNLVNVPVRKSFTLDIGLDKVAGKSSQEKLVVVRKLFSGINDFGGASTLSKFSGIIKATFTSELGLMKDTEKATGANVMINTNLKRSAGCSDRAVVLKEIPVRTSAEAVRAALSEFGIIKSIKMQLVGLWQKAVIEFEQSEHADLVVAEWSILIGKNAVQVARSDLDKKSWDTRDQHRVLLYTLPMGTTAYDIWDFIGSVGGKTCVIDRHPVTYARAKCAVVCFDSAELLKAIVGTTPVLRGTNLRWSCFVSAKCGKSGHMSLGCAIGGRVSSGLSSHRVLSDTDKSRLAAIYTKQSAPVARPVSFNGLSWAKVAMKSGSSSELVPSLPVLMEVNDRFAAFECNLASLVEQVGKLAKRLDALGPMVSQLSPGCQLLVTPSSQNQGADIVMSKGLGAATSGEIVAGAVSFDVSLVSKLEDSMKCLMETVLGLSAKVDSFGAGSNSFSS